MEQRPHGRPKERPMGVTILAVLYIIQGIILMTSPFLLSSMLGFDLMGNAMCFAPFIIIGLIPFLIGYGLWEGMDWARILAFIFAIIGLIAIPIGTIISIIIIIYLRKPEVKAYFD